MSHEKATSEKSDIDDATSDSSLENHCSTTGVVDLKDDLQTVGVAMETADSNHCTADVSAAAAKQTVSMETADNHCAAAAKFDSCAATDCGDATNTDMKHDDHDTCHAIGIDADSNMSKPQADSPMVSPKKSADTLDPGEADLSLGTLKKDDSGIVCEKSPDAFSKPDPGEKSRTHYPSTSNESEGVVADFADDGEAILDVSLKSDAGDDGHDDANISIDAEGNTSSDESDHEVGAAGSAPALRRKRDAALKRRRSRSRSGDSSSQSETRAKSDTDTDSNAAKSDDDDNNDDDMDVDLTSSPRDPWRPVHELRRREVGQSARMPTPYQFRLNTGASIGLVKRLEQQYKLEHHDGCVNALNFNDSGTLLASGSDDLNIVIWDWARNKHYMVFDSGHRGNVFQSKFMPYSSDMHIVSCARDGQVRLAELSTTGVCKGTKKLAQHRGAAHKLALLTDSSHVFYSCGEDGITYEIDLRVDKPANKLCATKENNKKVQLYSIHSNPFKSHEFCVGGRDHYIRVYDKRMLGDGEEGEVLKKFCPHHLLDSEIKANVTCAVYNYSGTEILGTYNDEHIYLFNNEHSDGANYIHRYQGHRNNATVKGVNFYGPRSEFVISGSDCSNVLLWEKESEKIVQYFHADEGGVINVLEPHPHSPILATSGLDHDVKIWAPTAKEHTTLEGLRQLVRKNHKEREEERVSEPDMIDGQMLWLLMQHLRRTTRRRAREEGEEASSSSSDSDNESEDGSEDMPDGVQCASS